MNHAPTRPRAFPLRLERVAAGATAASVVAPSVPSVTSVLSASSVASAPSAPSARALLRPQRTLHDAVRDATRPRTVPGLGLDSLQVRRRMVARLAAGGVRSRALLDAFAAVPRHAFVDPGLATQAYEDTSLPIGLGQTISKPSVVARMLDLLLDGSAARERGALGAVLEIGSGCGFQTALLALLAGGAAEGGRVVSIERLAPLHQRALHNLRAVQPRLPGAAGLTLLHGDGMLGHPAGGPYDSIVAACGAESLPAAWLDQLAPGGRLVAPVHGPPAHGVLRRQRLLVVDRTQRGYLRTEHESVHFVALKSGIA